MSTSQTTTPPESLGSTLGSALYRSLMESQYADDLMHQVWDATPWIVDAITGGINSDRWREVMEWLREQFGPEAWPIHGKAGDWHTGGATIDGKTWIGFATAEMMERFIAWQNDQMEARDNGHSK